jgi:hypothetical protein
MAGFGGKFGTTPAEPGVTHPATQDRVSLDHRCLTTELLAKQREQARQGCVASIATMTSRKTL